MCAGTDASARSPPGRGCAGQLFGKTEQLRPPRNGGCILGSREHPQMLGRYPSEGVRTEQIRAGLLRSPRDQLRAPPCSVVLPVAPDTESQHAPQVIRLTDLGAGGSNRQSLVGNRNADDDPSRMRGQRISKRRDANAGPDGLDNLIAVNDRSVRPAGPRNCPDNAAADFVGRAEQDAHDYTPSLDAATKSASSAAESSPSAGPSIATN